HSAPTDHEYLALHDALPIYQRVDDCEGLRMHVAHLASPPLVSRGQQHQRVIRQALVDQLHEQRREGERLATRLLLIDLEGQVDADRKSTRLNSSHVKISYAV